MSPCCTNTVTPKMIRTGQVKIGDRIQMEDPQPAKPVPGPRPDGSRLISSAEISETSVPVMAEAASSAAVPAASAVPAMPVSLSVPAEEPAAEAASVQFDAAEEAVPVQMRMTPGSMGMQNQMPMQNQMRMQNQMPQMQMQNQMQMPGQMGMQASQPVTQAPSRLLEPINYSQMTPYLEQVTLEESTVTGESSVTLPQSPMTGQDFTQSIDITDVQAFTGFLRTQLGRYMRVEQLIGSNIVEDRFGFLVGIGTNFIILQEITTGNIMVIDLFTIRMTYIYYSQPIFPEI